MKKTQILMIHGGMTFKNKKDYLSYLQNRPISLKKKIYWSEEYLDKALGNKFEIIRPRMPLQDNAKYSDWKAWFERYVSLLGKDFILIGSSLGGIFLAKYLSENILSQKARVVYFIGPPYDNTLVGEDLVGGFRLKSDLSLISKNTNKLSLMFSADDDVVPVFHAEKYREKLNDAQIIIYKSKNGHFKISKFPEIVKMIKEN